MLRALFDPFSAHSPAICLHRRVGAQHGLHSLSPFRPLLLFITHSFLQLYHAPFIFQGTRTTTRATRALKDLDSVAAHSIFPVTLRFPFLSFAHTLHYSHNPSLQTRACTTQVQDTDPLEDAQGSSASTTAILNHTANLQENAPVSSAWTEVELAIDEANEEDDSEPQETGRLRGSASRAEIHSERTATITNTTTHSLRTLEGSSSERPLPSIKNPLSRILNSVSIAFSSSASSSSSSTSSYFLVRTDTGSEAEEGRAQPCSGSSSGEFPSAIARLGSNSASGRRLRLPPTTDGVFANLSAKPEVEGQKDNQQRPPVNKERHQK